MLNAIWLVLVLGSILCAAYTGRMEALQKDLFDAAKGAVQLVIGLVGSMAFFLGLMRVAREGGLLEAVSRLLAPLLRRLFPDVPGDHPAMGAMVMNLAANVLGLGNAATPFGLKAMTELDRLNPSPGTATNAMVLFLAVNATSISLFPFGTAAVRAGAGSEAPLAIWVPTLIATTASTLTAVLAHFLWISLRRRGRDAAAAPPAGPLRDGDSPPPAEMPEPEAPLRTPALHEPGPPGARRPMRRAIAWGFALALLATLVLHVARSMATLPADTVAKDVLSNWLLPIFIASLLLYGFVAGVRVYDAAVEGAREALEVGVRIVPFLVVILVAVAMFRASGALDFLIAWIHPVTSLIGFPAEALPMALLRPLSGSGAFGVMSEALRTHGPDSFVGMLVSTLQGSTETTFYVLAVYFGAARVRNGRHCLAVCLLGDLAGFVAATASCHAFFG